MNGIINTGPPRERITSRPRRLRIGHMLYTVFWDQAKIDREARQNGCDYAGMSSSVRGIIAVDPTMGADYEAEVLLHEVLHQCLRVAGVDPDRDAKVDPDNVEERTVLCLAGVLLGALRDNPQLVDYLLIQEGLDAD